MREGIEGERERTYWFMPATLQLVPLHSCLSLAKVLINCVGREAVQVTQRQEGQDRDVHHRSPILGRKLELHELRGSSSFCFEKRLELRLPKRRRR